MKIGVCGELYSNNLGDPVIVESVKYIVEKNIEHSDVTLIDLDGRTKFNSVFLPSTTISKKKSAAKEFLKVEELKSLKHYYKWKKSDEDRMVKYFNQKIKGLDLIIIAGGQLIMNNNLNFPLRLNLLSNIAKKNNVPIIFNACGVQKHEKNSYGTRLIKSYLNRSNTKSVSTRDDIETLKEYLNQSSIRINKTIDPAVVCNDLYSIKHDRNSSIIGLGVISPIMYKKYFNRTKDKTYLVDEVELLNYWVDIIDRLNDLKIKWTLFTNGDRHDYKFAQEIINNLSKDNYINFKIEHPVEPKKLVEVIAGFNSTISHRLHSQIIAFALGIPSIGLIWDSKVYDFSLSVGKKKNFYNIKTTSPKEIISHIQLEFNNNYLQENTEFKKIAELTLINDIQKVLLKDK